MADARTPVENEARQAFLLKLSDALQPLSDPVAIRDTAARVLGEHLQSACAYVDRDEAAREPPMPSPWDGRVGIIRDTAADLGLTQDQHEAYRRRGIGALIDMPLVKEGRLVGALVAYQRAPRDWTPEEIRLVEETAERTWAASERARAEARLQASEERFRQFGDNSSDVLWIVDRGTGQLEYLSPAYERIWGEPRDAVMADIARWADRLHPDDRAMAAQAMPMLMGGQRFAAEYRIVRPDGTIRWIHDNGFPIRDDGGRVIRAAGIAQDTTERHRAEDALRESERRFRLLSEGIPQLVWRAGKPGEWTWASPQWTAFTGQSDADSHAWGWLEPLHPEDRPAARSAWARAAAGEPFEVDYRIRRAADGGYRWFQTRATPVRDEAGTVVEWIGTSTDVDDVIALQKRQELLLAELQHRVRNTLSVVRSIARRTAKSNDNIDDYTAHFDGRLNAFARTQAAVTRDPAAGVDLGELIAEELVAHGARDGAELRLDGPPLRLQSKAAELLGLAVHELATNAVKYGALTGAGGQIDVTWRLLPAEAASMLRLEWRERLFGREVGQPRRRGFGTEMLERSLAYDLGAQTTLRFAKTGVSCVIELPLDGQIAAT